jgi:hypothetical protein
MTLGELQTVKGKVFSLMTLPKHFFGVRKENGKWIGDHLNSGRSLGIAEDSQQKAVDKIMSMLSNKDIVGKIKEMPTIKQTKETFEKLDGLIQEFEEITEIKLNKYSCGVDVKELITLLDIEKEDIPSEIVLAKFGERADEIVKELLTGGVLFDGLGRNPRIYLVGQTSV